MSQSGACLDNAAAPHAIAGDAADLFVPFVFFLWWATADTSSVDAPHAIGIRTTGHNRGDTGAAPCVVSDSI